VLRGGVIKINWRLDVETDKGELHMHFSYDSETGTLSTVIEPIEPELVTEAVYEIMHWCETFLHKKPRLVEEEDDRD
jgi:hypothetical protein